MFGRLMSAGAVAALLAMPLSAQGASATEEPLDAPPEQIAIDLLTVNGSGCPPTAAVAVNADNTAFSLTQNDFEASVGVGAGPMDFRKTCQLTMAVKMPTGYSYAIAGADYQVYAYLAEGASASFLASHHLEGSSEPWPHEFRHMFQGPMDETWTLTDVIEQDSLTWSTCGEIQNLHLNMELRVDAGTSDPETTTSLIALGHADGELETTYHLAFRECPEDEA